MTHPVEVFADGEALAVRAADLVVEAISEAREARGKALVALSGGSTPRRTYELLGAQGALSTGDVEVLFVDERCVPPDDHASNYRLVAETIGDHGNVRRMRGEDDPDDAARAYEALLRSVAHEGVLDLVLLGIGGDGHTASLFPGAEELDERERWVVATRRPHAWIRRITLTLPVLNSARSGLMLATGREKAKAVAEVLSGGISPAARVLGARLLLDEAASGAPRTRPARPEADELFDPHTESGAD